MYVSYIDVYINWICAFRNVNSPYRRKNEDLKTPDPVSLQKPMSVREGKNCIINNGMICSNFLRKPEKEDEKDDDLWQLWNRMYSTTGKTKESKDDIDENKGKEYAYKVSKNLYCH